MPGADEALTVEAGLCVRPAEDVPGPLWRTGIGIEDDALVTPDGCELIGRGGPVRADAIEALMRKARAGTQVQTRAGRRGPC